MSQTILEYIQQYGENTWNAMKLLSQAASPGKTARQHHPVCGKQITQYVTVGNGYELITIGQVTSLALRMTYFFVAIRLLCIST